MEGALYSVPGRQQLEGLPISLASATGGFHTLHLFKKTSFLTFYIANILDLKLEG